MRDAAAELPLDALNTGWQLLHLVCQALQVLWVAADRLEKPLLHLQAGPVTVDVEGCSSIVLLRV